MNYYDRILIAEFLTLYYEEFQQFLSKKGIDETEAEGLIDSLETGAVEESDDDRLCPHDEMHDRIRAAFGYVRDSQDGDKSVCALCWFDNIKDASGRFHSPHGSIVNMIFNMTALEAGN